MEISDKGTAKDDQYRDFMENIQVQSHYSQRKIFKYNVSNNIK